VVAPPPVAAPTPKVEPTKRRDVQKSAREIGAPLLQWAPRIGIGAVALAALVVGGSAARRSFVKWWYTPRVGTAILETIPAGSEISIDGVATGMTPLTRELTAGRHTIEFRRRGAIRKFQIEVPVNKSITQRLDWTAKPTGHLDVKSEPPARVLVDGQMRGMTPLTLNDLTIGSHNLVLESPSGTLRRSVTIAEDQTTEINESIFSGWIRVISPIELEVSDGQRAVRLDEKGEALLAPGAHDLRLENRAMGYSVTRHVEVKPGETASVTIVPPTSTLTVTATMPSEVYVDGQPVGQSPLTGYTVALGTREILVKSAAGMERRLTTVITVKPVRLDVDFSKP
jgi:hypothetical protein